MARWLLSSAGMHRIVVTFFLAAGCAAGASAPGVPDAAADGSPSDAHEEDGALAEPELVREPLDIGQPARTDEAVAAPAGDAAPSSGPAAAPANGVASESMPPGFEDISVRDRARLVRAARRARAGRLGNRARLAIDGVDVRPHGFPAISRSGDVVALVSRSTELCAEGQIELVDAHTGVHIESIPLPVSGSDYEAEYFDVDDCRVDRGAARRIGRRLAREGFRALPAAQHLRIDGVDWWVGGGIAVREEQPVADAGDETYATGPTLRAYDVQTGELRVAFEETEDDPTLSAIPGASGLVISYSFCGCRCGYSDQLWPR